MNWIESINLKLTESSDASKIRNVFKEVKTRLLSQDQKTRVKLYRSTRSINDWSIHLLREFSDLEPEKTEIGQNVANIVSSFGDVDHAIWRKAG
ncbi:hypothetical protein KJ966_20560 [bacterium]|nr:hypothetical protein [bacterium]